MKTLIALCLILGAAGCGNVPASFVESERAFFDAVSPEYQAYYTADPNLTPEEKRRRDRTLELKAAELAEHEAAVGSGR